MITAFFIFDSRGDVLISKLYKEGVKRSISDVFRIQVIAQSNKSVSSGGTAKDVRLPVLTLGLTSFIYITAGLLWFTAVTRLNQDCSAILEFLYKLNELLRAMLLGSTTAGVLTSDVIENNFSMVYELLDEVVEFGYPTNMELSSIRPQLSTGYDIKIKDKDKGREKPVLKSNNSSHSNVTWRSANLKYRRNEIFLNVEEKINVLMNAEGDVLQSYVDGAIQMKTHLSGMPECRFGLGNDSVLINPHTLRELQMANEVAAGTEDGTGRVVLEDSKFHQCVELHKFDSERVIQFVPPDGEFQLMTYHCRLNVNLPFKMYAQVQEVGRLKILYKVRIKSLFPVKLPATNVVVTIPTPKSVVDQYMTSLGGKCRYDAEQNAIVWKFGKFFGEQEHLMTADVAMATGDSIFNWSRPTISLSFSLDMFSGSGLTVKFLKVLELTRYRTVKWVKYGSQAGSYVVRY